MPELEPQTKTRPARDPQALSSEYHKARKQLMLWSGILFVWSLIGIDLEKAKEAGGNTGALIKSIKSPQAIPWALVIMVGYFIFKVRIEWRQSSEGRRAIREAKQDYYSACIVAGLACLLYLGQTMSQIQFADVIEANIQTFWGVVYGFMGSAILLSGVISFRREYPRGETIQMWLSAAIVLIGSFTFVMSNYFRFSWRAVVVGAIGACSIRGIWFAISTGLKNRRSSTGVSKA